MTSTAVKEKEIDVTCNDILSCFKKIFCGCVEEEKKRTCINN